jgi:hypothetical protein
MTFTQITVGADQMLGAYPDLEAEDIREGLLSGGPEAIQNSVTPASVAGRL